MFRKCFVILLLSFISTVLLVAAPLKVACVGDSITYGSRIENRAYNSYPAQLGRMLGPGFQVENFGVSGATLLRNGNKPYNQLPEFQQALEFTPDIVLIKLGSNDSKRINRPFFGELKSDYHQLIEAFRKVNPQARIIVLTPVPAFNFGEPVLINPQTVSERIIPLVREVAYESGCEILDLYHLFLDRERLFPDKVHPNREGAMLMALRIQEALLQEWDLDFDLSRRLAIRGRSFNFHGFKGLEFLLDQQKIQVVFPKHSNPDHSWILRPEFFGHQPQVDISLLERGYHLVSCDVSGLYGNPDAVQRITRGYMFFLRNGLQCKVALEGFSRGGLAVYNWFAANPEKVSCVYADAPVLDIKSWPGGLGKSQGSSEDWKKCRSAYGLEEEQSLAGYVGSPLDNALIFAKSGKPMLHVYGEEDSVVPPEENTIPFVRKIREYSGKIQVIAKPGIGHHPHSLPNPTKITEFILAATSQHN